MYVQTPFERTEISPFWNINPFGCNKRTLFFMQGKRPSMNQLVFSEKFLSLWTLIHKYGKVYYTSPPGNKHMVDKVGECIRTSLDAVAAIREDGMIANYVEGFTASSPFSIHAWVSGPDNKHDTALDFTRPVHPDNRLHERYFGIEFEPEFFDRIWHMQDKDPRTILPNLKSGKCILTYAPFYSGQFPGYEFNQDDFDEAIEHLDVLVKCCNNCDFEKDKVWHNKLCDEQNKPEAKWEIKNNTAS